MIFHDLNFDDNGQTCYHIVCYRGNFDCLVALLNYERMCLKKVMYDQLGKEKSRYRMKTMDIKQGELDRTIQHDADTIRRHQEFELRLVGLLEQYVFDVLKRYRDILTLQDEKHKRNPIHYAAMAKGTNSLKTLEAILDIDVDQVPGFGQFFDLFTQLQCFELAEETFDPRRSANVLLEFKQLMRPSEFNLICREFKVKAKLLLKEVLNQQDKNYQSPLHIASYFGVFKVSSLL